MEELKEQNSKLLEALDAVNHEKSVFIESYEKEKEKNKELVDKIKAKIEELDEKLEYEINGWESEYEYCKEVLQSLLERSNIWKN